MKYVILVLLFVLTSSSLPQSIVDELRKAYPLVNTDEEACKREIEKFEERKSASALETAYRGAYYMVSAKHLSTPLSKLNAFKKGHGLLEQAIKDEPGNVEIHFLRLTIQHNAPSILGYNKNMKEDLKIVMDHYDPASTTALQRNIKDFIADTKLTLDNVK